MKYCTHCGKELDDDAVVCSGCGCPIDGAQNVAMEDTSNKGLYSVLSFLFPIVGLVLFLVWNNSKPTVAKSCGICALASSIIGVVINIIYFVFVLSAM